MGIENAVEATSLPKSTSLAIERTRLAHERTLMAWVRTAVSLISFGFTIYKFFDYMRQHGQPPVQERLLGPREYALVMTSIGLVALLLSTVQHRLYLERLREKDPTVPYSTATVIAALVSLLGIATLIAVLFRQ